MLFWTGRVVTKLGFTELDTFFLETPTLNAINLWHAQNTLPRTTAVVKKALDNIDLNLVSHRYVSGVLKDDHFVSTRSLAPRFNLVPRVLSLLRESTLVVAGHVSMHANRSRTEGGSSA